MKSLFSLTVLALLLGCQPKPPAPVQPAPVPSVPSQSVGTVVAGSGNKPAILEAEIEGVGKAIIEGRSIRIKLPASYTKTSIRLDYKVTEGVKMVQPASGTDLPIRDFPVRPICIQQDESGNCQLSYQLIIEIPSLLAVSPEPATMQLQLTQFYQPYEFVFRLGNLKTASSVTRNFKIRLVNKATGFSYTGDNYMVYDLAGQPVYVNQLNALPVPNEGKLQMTGTLPLGMSAGEYVVTILLPTCYAPGSDGTCSSLGHEFVELPTPLLIKAGPPLVGFVNPLPVANHQLLISGRNFSPTKKVMVRLTNDFIPALAAQATVLNDTTAQLTLPAQQAIGHYQLNVEPEAGKPFQSLFAIPSQKTSATFAYVASMGQFAASQNWYPKLPVFKRGESLEMRYTFTTGEQSYSSLMKRTVKQVRLINATDEKLTYALQNGGSFQPFSLATDFYMWKWTIPNQVPAGEYALVFEDFDGRLSLPYYQKIRIE